MDILLSEFPEGIIKDGYFIIPGFNISIKITNCKKCYPIKAYEELIKAIKEEIKNKK